MSHGSDYSEDGQGYGHGKGYGHGGRSDFEDLSDDQHKVMKFALGNNTSDDDTQSQMFLGLVVVGIIITLLFVLMSLPSFDRVMSKRMSDYNKRLATKAFIFLFLVVIFLWCVSMWAHDNNSNGDYDDYDDCYDESD
jgi:hypothetical protein